jgi:hypothetical protein
VGDLGYCFLSMDMGVLRVTIPMVPTSRLPPMLRSLVGLDRYTTALLVRLMFGILYGCCSLEFVASFSGMVFNMIA